MDSLVGELAILIGTDTVSLRHICSVDVGRKLTNFRYS